MRGLAFIALSLILTSPFIGSAGAQHASAEFLIVEHPDRLRIYDRFEQYVSDPASRGVIPFAAFQLVVERATLGDGITQVMSVRFNGEPHSLIRDPETGRLIGERDLGSVKRVRGARAHWDTVEVLATAGLTLRPESGIHARTLPAGTTVYRLFSAAGRTYVRTLERPADYGWLEGGPEANGRSWGRPLQRNEQKDTATSDLADRIRERVGQTNILLSRIYATVGREASRRLQTPQWHMDIDGPSIRCWLDPLPSDSARASTILLGKYIEGLTLGTRYRVHSSPGHIEVRP